MTLSGSAKVAGVVGWPVAHSLSPLIHNAWIEALGLDAAYVPFAVPPERFQRFVDGLRGGAVGGVNVTLPHKRLALDLAEDRSPRAGGADAANVLVFRQDASVFADNTDGEGLLAALDAGVPDWRVHSGPAVVLGAGGAAFGAVHALLGARVPAVRIVARRPGAAAALVQRFGFSECEAYGFDRLSSALEEATLVVNATFAGLNGEGTLPPLVGAQPGTVALDMVYRPLRTGFLADAEARRLRTVDGLAMLVGQARPSFEALFGVPPPPPEVVDVRALCLRAMGEGA